MKIHIAVLAALVAPCFATGVKLERVPENGLQPQVATTEDGTVHLVYLTGKPDAADIRYVKRGPKDTAWSTPLTVNSDPGSAVAVGTIRGAQLAPGKAGRVHVVWNGCTEKGQHAAAPLCYTRQEEDGRFSPQRSLNTGTIHLDGGASVAADAKGNVYVIWHASPPDGKSEADRRIYLCRSTDDGATFTAATVAPGSAAGVCACCSLKAYVAANGALLTLYRNASAKDQRDMTVLSSSDGTSFNGEVLHPWSIAACPMSSAAMLSTGSKATRAAWETNGTVYTALLGEKSDPLALSNGKARHPAIAVNARGEALVTWSLGTGWKRGGELGWILLDASGKPTFTKGTGKEVPVWSNTATYATASGDFVILH